MKKKVISLRGLSEILSEKELKNVMGGSDIGGNGTAGNCCYSGTADIGGQWVFYLNCGVTASYCAYLAQDFSWQNGFYCNCF